MGERLTWEEIVDKYPNQWVGLTDVDWEDDANVKAAVVKYVGKSSGELLMMQMDGENIVSFYTTPDSVEFLDCGVIY